MSSEAGATSISQDTMEETLGSVDHIELLVSEEEANIYSWSTARTASSAGGSDGCRAGSIDCHRQEGGVSTGRNDARSPSRDRIRSRTSGHKSKVDRGKVRFGSSKDEYKRKKVVKSGTASSDSEFESDRCHHHYHHHHHHHHHNHHKHHKHKKEKHKKKKSKRDYDKGLDVEKGKPAKVDHSQSSRQDLLQESLAIEEEIARSKREILKSSLRKERIELLHKNMHGKSMGGEEGSKNDAGERSRNTLSKNELQAQLVGLEKDIVTEKQKLLRVLTRLEQRQTD